MSARFGEIETLYLRVNASDILAEPDKQKQLNDVMLYLSELKEKTKEVERESNVKEHSATKIEITKMPELQIEGLKEIAKNEAKKPITSPLTKRELRKKLNIIIRTGEWSKKQKAFLQFLGKDFEPKTIVEISKEVATKACTKLKAGVQKKFKGTGFDIKTDKGGWGRKATYQLVYFLTSENS